MKVATIVWNENKDDTKIKFSEEFLSSDPLLRADILSDLNGELGQIYLDTVKKLFPSKEKAEEKCKTPT